MKRTLISMFLFLLIVFTPAAAQDTIEGVVYHDADQSSRSVYFQDISGEDAVLPGISVYLMDGETEIEAITDEFGEYLFESITPGTYFVDVGLRGYESTSNNHAKRVPDAIREGYLNMVAFGDSIGVYGGEHQYPERFEWIMEDLVEIDLHNIHVGGSRSWEWLPGDEKAYWEERLVPLLSDADLVTFTLTGNDLDAYVEGMQPPYDMWQIVLNFIEHPEYALEAVPRLREILANVVAINDECDVVFIVYPNFANSTIIQSYTGDFLQPVAAWIFEIALGLERQAAADTTDVSVTDMITFYGDTWLDDYLVDEVHPSDLGSQDYAEQLFKALGGVIIPEVPSRLGEERMTGFYAPELVPGDDDDDDNDDDNNDDNDDNNDDDDNNNDDNDDNNDDNNDDDDTNDDDDIAEDTDDEPANNADDDDDNDGGGGLCG
ncbi:MAG: hypothetical protein P9L99_03005 [Candidatus Lernaella stagnicola]|nr:hypothetical protein [Candidatus Lernaella stagnicola]